MNVSVSLRPILTGLLLASMLLAGCSSANKGTPAGDTVGQSVPAVQATATTGGIRGVVVDEAVRPLAKVNVALSPGGKNTTTDVGGAFVFSGLDAGTYFLKVSSPLYSTVQQSVDVVAGVSNPPAVKIQLQRLISQTPYLQTLKFDGFIVCSIHTPVVLSEECGEGVGSPNTTCDEGLPPPCVANPVFPGQRVGHNADNYIQFNFQPDVGLKSMALEQVWDATSTAGSELYTPVGVHWLCAPNCGWDSVTELNGVSPTYAYVGSDQITKLNITAGENVTMFTWAGDFSQPAGVALQQKFTH